MKKKILQLAGEFNTEVFPTRTLGSIPPSNPTCHLFGWGGAPHFPEFTNVRPHRPSQTFCYTNRSQTYCTEHHPQSFSCSAWVGSPLSCNPQSVDGILIETGCLEESPGRFLQAYHSVGEFREWIESVSGAKIMNQNSIVILLSALVICVKNLM